jgi:hypothetical protein
MQATRLQQSWIIVLWISSQPPGALDQVQYQFCFGLFFILGPIAPIMCGICQWIVDLRLN